MSKHLPNGQRSPAGPTERDLAEKLRRSRQRLLDLTLRNRLLNFRPGNPDYRDDLKAHKHAVFYGHLESIWQTLVEDEKSAEIVGLSREQQLQIHQELRSHTHGESKPNANTSLLVTTLREEEWEDVRGSIRGISQLLHKGSLFSLLPDESFRKRLIKIKNEQNTLSNSTGDSALFLAIGFLEWCEAEPHPRANEPLFAPLILIHVNLEQRRSDQGGEREFVLRMDADQAQGNPCLAEKLRQDFSIDLPELNLDEDETADDYFTRVSRAVRSKKNWRVNRTVALGFFNFARYRLWLDLNPDEWPDGCSPIDHPVVSAILNGDPLPQAAAIPDEEEVANHQGTDDLPVVMDSDSTQYAALLAARKSVSLVVQGPPGSGKSQTITNLIAIAMAEGKRVLFVAQKLPALQVVRRRLESVELAPFCLPLFSDKARVTELHKHLQSSARLRDEYHWQSSDFRSPVAAIANTLNKHASRLRDHPRGYNQSACALIQKATALNLMLRDIWANEWKDDLLNVQVPKNDPTPDWMEKREQTLNQWHRLKLEVANSWSQWFPVTLGPMDSQKVDLYIRKQELAAKKLREELSLLPEEFHNLTIEKVEQLIAKVSKSRFDVLTDVSPALVRFLWDRPENTAVVARLERDLEEFHRQLSKAQRELRVTEENWEYVASRATDALNSVISFVSPRCSLASARTSIDELKEIVRDAEDLCAFANLNPAGIQAICPTESVSQPTEFAWKHVSLLSNHRTHHGLHLPSGAKIALAAYVHESSSRAFEANSLAQLLSRYHDSVARLEARVRDRAQFLERALSQEFQRSVHRLRQYSFGEVRLCELPDLEKALSQVSEALCDVLSKSSDDFSLAIFGRKVLCVANIYCLAACADVPVLMLHLPANGTDKILRHLAGILKPVTALSDFRAAIELHQNSFREIRGWFPESQLGSAIEAADLQSKREAAQRIRDLGLQDQTLESLPQLLDKVARLRRALQNILDVFQNLFESWPLLPPESLEQIHQAKTLFLLLVNRPQPSVDLPVEALCLEANYSLVIEAMSESRQIQEFREKNSQRIAFRDLPDVETIASLRRDLRYVAQCWWRWFSSRYYSLRKSTRSFLIPPFPRDQEVLVLLDELETHERHRESFQGSSIKALFGETFRGIDTKWQVIEPTLEWIRELKSATQASEVHSFAQSSIQRLEKLRTGIKGIEEINQLLEQSGPALVGITPLSLLKGEPPKIGLQELARVLERTETELNCLVAQIDSSAKLQPEATFKEFLTRIDQLELFHSSAVALHKHSDLAEPIVAANLSTDAITEDIAWLSELLQQEIAPDVINALLKGAFVPEKHLSISLAAENFCAELSRFSDDWLKNRPGFSANPDFTGSELQNELHGLIGGVRYSCEEARICTFNDQVNVSEILESLEDANEVTTATEKFRPWKEVLHEEPASITSEQVSSTLDWVARLRQYGATGDLLSWILADETDNRVHWWQELVSRSQNLRGQLSKLQDKFSLSLNGPSERTLLDWVSDAVDRSAKVISALEIVESHSQSPDFTVHDLAQASASLRRAIELHKSLKPWRDRLGEEPAQLDVARIQKHRQWIAIARGLSPALGTWLTDSATTARCETLRGIEPKLNELRITLQNTKYVLESFGKVLADGPFSIFSLTGTPGHMEQNVQRFTEKMPLLPAYAAFLREYETAKKLGLDTLLKNVEASNIATTLLIDTFRGAVAYQQAKAIWEADDELRYFQSSEHERLRQKFQENDEKQLKSNRRYIRTSLGKGNVTQGSKGRTASEHTEFALLQHEMGKQRRHLPIRKLVQKASKAMQDLCPCWMMTPLAVAQFLAPEAINFDLVIMDEASQINPEDAWGAIARGKQLIVVGDQKQMPPSDFFLAALEEDESPEQEDEIDGGKSESILDASVVSLLSSPLLWHYRSRHERLIAPANSFSYDNRLILFPHPHRTHQELGIRYTYVTGATTSTGKVTNVLEAEAIAKRVHELVMREYAKAPKDRLTIGVVTMNLHQQDCVTDLLERIRVTDRRFDFAMAALTSEQSEEPLFVRNLENIQGDERDIMIISCTYGPHTPGGTPTQRFGPLNREGGERRFNVLITRAKWRMEIFASIRSDQILVDGKRQGVRDFHLFLKYVESGILMEKGESTGKECDSPFEAQVEAVLQRAGFQTERQVGVAGYFIDLGVKHPDHPGLFALGIECDGRTYHSSRAARDRDRLREKVLLERGWKLHRIWSTDWFVNPRQAKTRLIEAVRAASK